MPLNLGTFQYLKANLKVKSNNCVTALQKYAPKMKWLLDPYSKHFYIAKEKALNRSILPVIFCLIFSDIISKHILAPLKI